MMGPAACGKFRIPYSVFRIANAQCLFPGAAYGRRRGTAVPAVTILQVTRVTGETPVSHATCPDSAEGEA